MVTRNFQQVHVGPSYSFAVSMKDHVLLRWFHWLAPIKRWSAAVITGRQVHWLAPVKKWSVDLRAESASVHEWLWSDVSGPSDRFLKTEGAVSRKLWAPLFVSSLNWSVLTGECVGCFWCLYSSDEGRRRMGRSFRFISVSFIKILHGAHTKQRQLFCGGGSTKTRK